MFPSLGRFYILPGDLAVETADAVAVIGSHAQAEDGHAHLGSAPPLGDGHAPADDALEIELGGSGEGRQIGTHDDWEI